MKATSGRSVIISYVRLVVEVEVLHAALRVLRVHAQQDVPPIRSLSVAAAARPQVAPRVNHCNAAASVRTGAIAVAASVSVKQGAAWPSQQW